MQITIALIAFVIFYYSLVLHEVAHGWVALRFGDPTAKEAGRLSFKPWVHFDPIASGILPAVVFYFTMHRSPGPMFFGGVRPVPVDRDRLKPRIVGDILVTLAGVTVHAIIAVVFGLIHRAGVDALPEMIRMVIVITVISNVFLFFFNLIPIPPFDGGMLVRLILPKKARGVFDKLEHVGVYIAVAAFLFVPGLVGPVVNFLIEVISFLLGPRPS